MGTCDRGKFNRDVSMYAYMRAYREKGSGTALIRGRKKISYAALECRIARVAGGLYALGVKKGDVVIVALPNIEQNVPILYAVSRLGAILSPIHPLLSKEEFVREIELQKPSVIILSEVNIAYYKLIAKYNRKRKANGERCARVVFCPYWIEAYLGLPMRRKFVECTEKGDIPSLYMHSGGTSGAPKTVVLSASAANSLVYNLLDSIPYDFNQKDAMLVTLPMFHGFGLIVGIHVSLCTNMRAVLVPKFSGKRALDAIKRHRVTTVIAVPRMIKRMLETEGFDGDSIKSLANVYIGGDALDANLAADFDERMRSAGASAVAQQGYGLTETGGVCVLSSKGESGTVGKTLHNIEGIIVSDGKAVKDGESGELLLAGDQTMLGYLQDAVATEQAFEIVDGKKYLKTGDIFRKDARGNLHYLGRQKRLIKISGMNVFPTELERVACECEGVGMCAATEISVGGKTFIRLIVEGEIDDDIRKKLYAHIDSSLSHWYRPYEIISVKELPRTALGKINFIQVQKDFGGIVSAKLK